MLVMEVITSMVMRKESNYKMDDLFTSEEFVKHNVSKGSEEGKDERVVV